MTAASIAFRHVVKRYGDVVAVDGVSFDVAAGTLVTFLGPSGCGKTTILRMIAGLELPTSGRVLIGGEDVTEVGAAERDVSMVFQSYALFPHLSVLENVRYGLVVSGTARAEADERARSTLATVGLPGFDARLPSELSGGQQQRVAVARALVLEPAVLLFDEPLSNLDARLRRQMRDEIRELQQRLSLTVVYVTHDQAEAMAVSDRIVVMNRAVIAQEGAPRDLYERPRDPFVASFMGDANRVRGVLARRDGDLGDVHIGAVTLRLPHRGLPDGEVEIAIRPEAIELVDATGAPIRGTVRKASYLGGLMEYTLDTDVGELFATSFAVDCPRPPGSAVGVKLAGHGVVVIPGVGV
ncbi:MAG TPA: ABC transporter ATP-binding protein [Casimicrobiaceae bacterium]|nr:ABC transporter ATP-binding protein [Casimicrobiaceae bacterium]